MFDILKNDIDVDSIITSLYTKSSYTDLFLSLLRAPTPSLLSKLVITYLNKMLSDLKYLVKMKYPKLSLDTQRNIYDITLLLFGYDINVDSLIINLLRQTNARFPIEHKYFKQFKYTVPFIKYHTQRDIADISLTSTLISWDMESDILFMINTSSNLKFYVIAFISKYRSKISDILMYIRVKGMKGRNVNYLVNNLQIVMKMGQQKGDVSWMITDMEKEEEEEIVVTNIRNNVKVNTNVSKVNGMDKPMHNVSINNLPPVRNNPTMDKSMQNISSSPVRNISSPPPPTNTIPTLTNNTTSTNNVDSFLSIIADLSFPKYYSLIQDMKVRKSPILDPKLYKEVVFASFDYDNYVQVYLWKILVYQKILFDIEIEIEESDLKTEESLEGYDIYLNIH